MLILNSHSLAYQAYSFILSIISVCMLQVQCQAQEKKPIEASFRIHHLYTISEKDIPAKEDFFFTDPGFILQTDSKGNLIFAQDEPFKLMSFDSKGTFRYSFGREGAGPGEFRSIRNAFMMQDNSIFVYDMDLQRYTLISEDGKLLEQTLLPPRLYFYGNGVGQTNGTILYTYYNFRTFTPDSSAFYVFSPKEGKIINRFIPYKDIIYETPLAFELTKGTDILFTQLDDDTILLTRGRYYDGTLKLFRKINNEWVGELVNGFRKINASYFATHDEAHGKANGITVIRSSKKGRLYYKYYSFSYGLTKLPSGNVLHTSAYIDPKETWKSPTLVFEEFSKDGFLLRFATTKELGFLGLSLTKAILHIDQDQKIYVLYVTDTEEIEGIKVYQLIWNDEAK